MVLLRLQPFITNQHPIHTSEKAHDSIIRGNRREGRQDQPDLLNGLKPTGDRRRYNNLIRIERIVAVTVNR